MDIEVIEPSGRKLRFSVDRPAEVGRTAEVRIDDPEVSRKHLRLTPVADGFIATDLGSANGTMIDGTRLDGERRITTGAVIHIGGSIMVIDPDHADPRLDVKTAAQRLPRPDEFDARRSDAGSVRYRPGSAGERVAGTVLASLRKARRRLGALGGDANTEVEIFLIDPIPDPQEQGQMMTGGTLLDPASRRIWMIVTGEAPPEPVGRAVALLLGAHLPAGPDVQVLLEGLGLYVSDLPDPEPQLRGQQLPPLASAEGELRAAMALSFARFLVERSSEAALVDMLNKAQPNRVDGAAQELYGDTLSGLEEAWRLKLAGGPAIKNAQFLRLSLRYLKPNARRQGEICVYMLLGLGFNVIFPFVTKRLFDHAIPSGHFSQVIRLLGFLGAAFLVSMLAGLRQAQLSAYVSGSVVKQLRLEMFDRLQSLPTGWFAARDQSDVLSRMFSDVAVVESGLSQALRDGLFQILTLVAEGIVLLRLNLFLGLLVLISAPLVAVIYRVMGNGAQRRSLSVQERSNGLIGVTAENYLAQPVVKAFGLQGRERHRFDQSSDRLFVAQRRLALFGGLFGLSVNAVVTLLRLAVLAIGAYFILHGHLTVGGLVAFLGVMGEVISPVTALTSMGQALQQCTGALVRVNEILGAESDIVDQPGAPPLPRLAKDIVLEDVSFSYTSERQTLDKVSLTIPAGARVAFVGPSGAGKSSVLGLLQRNYDPDEGGVRFDGKDLRAIQLDSLRQQISVVFQDTFLFDTTIRENIALGRAGATDAEIQAAADQAGVSEFVAPLPRGLDTMVGERGGRLSGGQRQRVAIARALVRNPSVLILDEATSALDPRTERQIAATLDKLSHGRTTVAVTHRLTSITDYDCIFVINAGRLVEQGTHTGLLAQGGLYAQLWAEQTGGAVPTAAAFDIQAALRAIPLFAGLDNGALADIADRMLPGTIPAGRQVPEGGVGLVLIGSGHAVVEGPSATGGVGVLAQLGAGDVFGLSALLGRDNGTVMRSVDTVQVFVLDDDRIQAIAHEYPSVGAALTGGATPVEVPAGAQRLARLTMTGAPAAPVGGAPNAPANGGADGAPAMPGPRVTASIQR